MAGCADHRIRTPTDSYPHRHRRIQVGNDVLSREARPCPAAPGDRTALHDLGEQLRLLLEKLLLVGEVVAEERERLDARATAEDDLCPSVGEGVQGREALEHAYGVVRAKHRNRRSDVDARRSRGYRGEHDVGRRHREVVRVVLADAEEVEADLLCQNALLDHMADGLGVRDRLTVLVVKVTEGVQTERQRELTSHCNRFLLAHAATATNELSNSARLIGLPNTGPSGSSIRPA